jgi:O-antigen ligase
MTTGFLKSLLGEDRPATLMLALTAAAGFWSTAALELFAALFLATVLVQETSRNEHQRSRDFRPETLIQLLFWLLYSVTILVSFFNASSAAASLPLHMLWHPLLFPAVLMLGVREVEVRTVAVVFVISGGLSAIATLAMLPSSTSEHLEAVFVGDTTYFDILILAAIAGVCLALSGSSRQWIFLFVVLPAAAAVILSAQRAPAVIMLAASLLLVLAWRPRAAFAWLGFAALVLLLSPQALWLKLAWFFQGHHLDRYPVWTAGLQLLPSAPMFGHGPGSFAALLPAEARAAFIHRPPTSWHNDFLQTIFENGWLAAFAYAALLVSVVVPAVRASLRYRTTPASSLSAALTILLFSSLCCSALGLVISTSVLGAVFWVLLALTATGASKDHIHAR